MKPMASSLNNALLLSALLALLLCVGARDSVMFSKVSSGTSTENFPTSTEKTESTDETASMSLDVSGKTSAKNEGVKETFGYRRGEGMSDTRNMEGGKYFYDIAGEGQEYTKESSPYDSSLNSVQFHNEEGSFSTNPVNTIGEGLSDTRSMEGGKYYYDSRGSGHREAYSKFDNSLDEFNGVQFHGSEILPDKYADQKVLSTSGDGESFGQEKNLYDLNNAGDKEEFSHSFSGQTEASHLNAGQEERSHSSAGQEEVSHSSAGQEEVSHPRAGQNEERFVFDTMEEYEKYMASRHYKYKP